MCVKRYSAVWILLFCASVAYAQPKAAAGGAAKPDEAAQSAVWKKQIVRVVDMGLKADVSGHLADANTENTLIEMFVNLIKSNKIVAYTGNGNAFVTRLTVSELNRILAGRKDTVLTTDANGKTVSKVTSHELRLDSVHKYRILEEWSCFPATGKTEIQVIGVAPLKDNFNDDGTYRNSTPLFWLKFNDVSAILVRYQQYHPNNTLAGHIWDDYFNSDSKMQK